jgi:dienelactone hydrolase
MNNRLFAILEFSLVSGISGTMLKTQIRENGLVGTLFEPTSRENLPAIIVLPGSDGGIPEALAEQLASYNYIVLALGYFALEGLPEHLENIPLEYFEKAFAWLEKRGNVKTGRIGVMGYSRGGELALLLGSIFPQLMSAVVADVPGSVVVGGFPHPNQPAWTHENKPIQPFLGALMSDHADFTERDDLIEATKAGKVPFHAGTADDPYVITDLFLARNQEPGVLEAAAIRVEHIKCPILLISGQDDAIWPSALYAKRVMDRLHENKSTIERTHLSCANAGHGLTTSPYDGPIYHPVGGFWCKLGGTPEGNSHACKAAWDEVLSFLSCHLQED